MVRQEVERVLGEQKWLKKGQPLVLGVSGGADSMALLNVLLDLGWKVHCAHFDHQLRPESGDDARFVRDYCATHAIPFHFGTSNVAAQAADERKGIEETARLARYQFLAEVCRSVKAQALLTAHNADDQAETILMHFLRGSGLQGLTGMRVLGSLPFDQDIPLLRPLLTTPRAEVLAFIEEYAIPFRQDQSNLENKYLRNRLRLELLPELESYNPGVRETLRRNALAMQADLDYLETETISAMKAVGKAADDEHILLDRADFLKLPLALQGRVLLSMVFQLNPQAREVSYSQLERMRTATLEAPSAMDLEGGFRFVTSSDDLLLSAPGWQPSLKAYPQLTQDAVFLLSENRSLEMANGWQLHAKLIDKKTYQQLDPLVFADRLQAFVNAADAAWPLEVRPPRVGEHFTPFGMHGQHQKLSDFFINQKIPREAREFWPLVTNHGSVLWVAGLRISQAWRLSGDESQVLHLWLSQPG